MERTVAMVLVWCLGLLAATQVNRGIYRLAWNARPIGPWLPRSLSQSLRRPLDFVPLYGWWRLRRESPTHGVGYWVRPLLIELLLPLGLCWLLSWQLDGGLWPMLPGLGEPWQQTVGRFGAHAVLICLMMVATFVDIDEQTIPDSITIPGTLLGLCWMTWWPATLLPDADGGQLVPLLLTSPGVWSPELSGRLGWWLAIGCWTGWVYGLTPKTWVTRYGWWRALRYLSASVYRHPWTRLFGLLWVVGLLGITGVWWRGGTSWQGLMTSLAGLAYGGGIVWAVRIVGTAVLRREAMGFGDVTLMAMIGSFLGWQPALMIFFLAPFAGAVLAVVQRLIFYRDDIAYGPFLCLATLGVMLGWRQIWFAPGPGRNLFELGGLINAILIVCLVLMALLLLAWQVVQSIVHKTRLPKGRR
ncbi:MAG: A24 family peptidase [Pirellulales bacterium]